MDTPKFTSKRTVVTAGISQRMQADPDFGELVNASINRHFAGDWGDLGLSDSLDNDRALKSGDDRLFCVYELEGHPKIWIVTEYDYSVTTVLFPEEY